MKTSNFLFSLCLLFLVVSCSTTADSVKYDYDAKADFEALKTFDWLSATKKSEISEGVIILIKNTVNNQLKAKGLKRTSDDPDFLIALFASKEEKFMYEDKEYMYRLRSVTSGGLWSPDGIAVREQEQGTLTLDFVDSQSRELIWRGVAKAALIPSLTPEEQEKRITEVVQRLLFNFPPVLSK